MACLSKLEIQGFSEETLIAKELVLLILILTPIQTKILASKVSELVPSCTNKYVKKKNMTIFTKFLLGLC